MALAPQKFREIVFQLIYSEDFGGDADIVPMLMAQLCVTKRVMREACALSKEILGKRGEIDAVLRIHSASYDLERIPRVERNVIRLGIYELIFSKGVPPKVVIAEAMRLSRKFATPEAATFVNAILDSIFKELVMCTQDDSKDVNTPCLSDLSV